MNVSLPLLQSPLWNDFQHDLGETTFFQQTVDYTYLAIKKSTPLGPYLYLPYGPYLANENAARPALEAIQTLSVREHAIFIRFEPQSSQRASYWLSQPNCRKTADLNPAHTWRLDLTPDLDTLYANMRQNTRNLCKNYTKKGLSVTTTHNPAEIHHLVALQRTLASAKHISTFSEKYLQTELKQPFATLYLVKLDEEQVVGASLFFDFEGTRFYMQSATSLEYKKLPITYALLNEAIKDAKAKGMTTFDFWGIAPEGASANHPWIGFTAFKKSFGGYPITYAGTHDLVLSSTKYHAYELLRRANRLKRKIVR